MKLKRRSKAIGDFSMASMTDVIFLLLIFFMVSSTLVVPSALRVLLPKSSQQTNARPVTRVTVTPEGEYFVGVGNGEDRQVTFEEIAPFLQETLDQNPDMFVALYADEGVPYGEVVKVLNIAVENRYQMVLATRPLKE